MVPSDRLVCAFVQPSQCLGTQFKDWPLHVTVVAWFRLEDESKRIAVGLTESLTAIIPFEAKAGDTVKFGPNKTRLARLLEVPTPFIEIEQKVRNYFHKRRAWLVDETTKRHRDYRPHVTDQKSGKLSDRQTFRVEQLYIIEQKGNYKEIVAEIPFGQTTFR